MKRWHLACSATGVSRWPLASVVLLAVACGGHDSPTSTSSAGPPLSEQIETAAFLFRFSAGDSIDVARQQAFHDWAPGRLGVPVPRRITYNKYLSRAHMGQIIGVSNTNAWADRTAFAIHTIWPFDNHETVHLYASVIGDPPALLSEGLAVSMQTDPASGDFDPKWSGVRLDDLARRFRAGGALAPIDRMLQTSDFRNLDPNISYPEAGSFVHFLVEAHGLDRFKMLYARGGPNDPAAAVRAAFADVYGLSVADLEAEWWRVLGIS